MGRRLRRLAGGLLLTTGALVPVGAWLLGSSSGAATLLRLVPGLEVARVQGRLLDDLRLQGVHWTGGGATLLLPRLTLTWSPAALWRGTLQIDALRGRGLRLALPTAPEGGSAGPGPPPPLRLPLALRLGELRLEEVQVQQGDRLLFAGDLEARARGQGGQLELERVRVREPRLQLQLHGRLPLDGGDGLAIALQWSARSASLGELRGSAELDGRLAALRIHHRLTAPWPVEVRGTLRPFDDLRLDLDGHWEALAWPPGPRPRITSPRGEFQLRGTPAGYGLSLLGELEVTGLPSQRLRLQASGDTGGLELQHLQVTGPAGRARATGRVAWAPRPSWDLQLDARQIDPAPLAPEWPGAIDLQGRLAGGLGAGGLVQTLDLKTLRGRLRGYPVSGRGRLRQRGTDLEFQGVALHSGSNALTLEGRLGAALDLAFALSVDRPEALLPGLAGELQARGRLQGTRDDPRLEMTAQGSGLAWSDQRLARLSLEARWGLGEGEGRIHLEGEGLAFAGQHLTRLEADLEGETRRHRLRLQLQGEGLGAQADATGGWGPAGWEGRIETLSLTQAIAGEWVLARPAGLALSRSRVRLDPSCLAQGQTRLCGRLTVDASRRLDAAADLEGLELAQWLRRLDLGVRGTGELAARLTASGDLDAPTIEIRVEPAQGTLQWPLAGGGPLTVDYRLEQMAYRQRGDRGTLDLGVDLGPRGRLTGRLSRRGEALGGGFQLTSEDPSWLGDWLTGVSEIRGRLHLEGRLGGTLQAPALTLQGGLTQGHLVVADTGIEVQGIELGFSPSTGGRFALHGTARSGGGDLEITGWVDTAIPSWSLELRGEAFQVVRLPTAEVWVSPELQFAQQGGRRRLAGEVRIPRAKIELQELPEGTVSETPDLVLVDRRGRPIAGGRQASPGYLSTLELDLTLRLGDRVRLSGYGLETRLSGRLHLTSSRGRTLAEGRIDLHEGVYKAYGQDLTLERGHLIFSGPLDNPALDLLAYRKSDDGSVKALLKVTGDLHEPKLEVSSEPALPAGEALAYLITGHSLADASKGEGANIYSAALSLGLARSEPLLLEMRDRLGLDELRLKGGKALEESTLSLGKQLSPNLYLGYTLGLFDATGSALLRLRLGKRLELESRSGETRSVDLFYRLEHD